MTYAKTRIERYGREESGHKWTRTDDDKKKKRESPDLPSYGQ